MSLSNTHSYAHIHMHTPWKASPLIITHLALWEQLSLNWGSSKIKCLMQFCKHTSSMLATGSNGHEHTKCRLVTENASPIVTAGQKMTHIGVVEFFRQKRAKTKLLIGAVENNLIWQHKDPPLGYTVCTISYN